MANPFDFSQFGFETPQFDMPDFESIQNGTVQGQQGQGAANSGGQQPGPVASPEIANDLGGGMGNFDFGNMFGNSGGSSSSGGMFGNSNNQQFMNMFNSMFAEPAPTQTAPAPTPQAAPAPTPAPTPAAPEPAPVPTPEPAPAAAPAPQPAATEPEPEPEKPEWRRFDEEAFKAQYEADNKRTFQPEMSYQDWHSQHGKNFSTKKYGRAKNKAEERKLARQRNADIRSQNRERYQAYLSENRQASNEYDNNYHTALVAAKTAHTEKYGDGGAIGELTQMVADLQAQIGQNQSQGQSGDGGFSNTGSNLGMGGDSQASTRAMNENGGGRGNPRPGPVSAQISTRAMNENGGGFEQRRGAGGRTYRDNMQANRGNMRNPSSGMTARDRANQLRNARSSKGGRGGGASAGFALPPDIDPKYQSDPNAYKPGGAAYEALGYGNRPKRRN